MVLANLATIAQTLTNWRLVDKNARVTSINAKIGPGQFDPVALDGTGVQLGNQGGNLMLQDFTTPKLTSSPTRPTTRQSRTVTFASAAEIKTSRTALVIELCLS